MPRRPLTISRIRVAGTRRAKATLFTLKPYSAMNSFSSISPGCTGCRFFVVDLDIGTFPFHQLVVVNDLSVVRVVVTPPEAYLPLVIDADAELTRAVSL